MSNSPAKPRKPESTERTIRRKTIVSFTIFVLLLFAGWQGWQWLYLAPPAKNDIVQKPLRKVLEVNEQIFTTTFDTAKSAKKFAKEDAVKKVRVNGNLGLSGSVDTLSWRLHVVKGQGDTLTLTLADIKRLPRTEVVFDFKCIEGWDQVTHWAGVKMTDFIRHYHLERQKAMKYIGMVTPDGGYYVGIDMPSILQSQTILCYEMNGEPLPQNQGYPLRFDHSGKIWHQTPETNWHHLLQQYPSRRLLG